MEKYFCILILLIILIIIQLIYIDDHDHILINDNSYFEKFSQKYVISKLLNNNLLSKPVNKQNKILFISYDDRYNEEYIQIHNNNINAYANKWNYQYKFYNRCIENVYWCKIYMVLNALLSNNYDYVCWLDSDTIIKNFNIDIGNIFNKYSSDVFIGSDNNPKYDLTNSGVFIIKNSIIGLNFLLDCINFVSEKCINIDGTLKGIWAASCYEQGVMNIMIVDKYSKYTTILNNDIIFNYNVCSDEVFIMHLYASPSTRRVKCFNSKNPALQYLTPTRSKLIY